MFTNITTSHTAVVCKPAGYRLAAERKHDIT